MDRNEAGATVALTAAALIGFAANSLLCRLALAAGEIDAASYTAVRMLGGAVVLGALAARRLAAGRHHGSWLSAAALFAYAAPFSFAYLRLGAGLGALVLFGAVQATMIGWGLARGERPPPAVWLGLATALGGLAVLTAPGAAAPDPLGAALMAGAGVAWGAYSLRGKGAGDPLPTTAANFVRAVPMAAVLLAGAATTWELHASGRGLILAAASGGVASGLGYAAWYAALRHLTAVRAAALQLLVPILAAAGGVVLLDERVTPRLAAGAALVVGGVAVAIRGRTRAAPRPTRP